MIRIITMLFMIVRIGNLFSQSLDLSNIDKNIEEGLYYLDSVEIQRSNDASILLKQYYSYFFEVSGNSIVGFNSDEIQIDLSEYHSEVFSPFTYERSLDFASLYNGDMTGGGIWRFIDIENDSITFIIVDSFYGNYILTYSKNATSLYPPSQIYYTENPHYGINFEYRYNRTLFLYRYKSLNSDIICEIRPFNRESFLNEHTDIQPEVELTEIPIEYFNYFIILENSQFDPNIDIHLNWYYVEYKGQKGWVLCHSDSTIEDYDYFTYTTIFQSNWGPW